MKRIALALLVPMLGLSALAQRTGDTSLAEAKRVLQAEQQVFIGVAKQVTPSIVYIEVERDRGRTGFFDDMFDVPRKVVESGSGVIVRSDGLIVTNNHIVHGVSTCKVRLSSGDTVTGQVLGSDPATDIAAVKVDGHSLPALRWGDSDKIEVGQWVLAVGNPYGLDKTVTRGIVSAKGRQGLGVLPIEDFIQTDAAINPGNSGGALVNLDGELIGINSVIFTQSGGNQGIGFAIPATTAKGIVQQIADHGSVPRGWLGFVPMRTDSKGVTVYRMFRRGPAHLAGLHGGDRIVRYGQRAVDGAAQLRKFVVSDKPGTTVTLTIEREGEQQNVTVKLGSLPQEGDGAPAQVLSESI